MFKRLWEWIKYPHGWALLPLYLLTAGCIAGAIVLSIVGQSAGFEIAAYILYAFAAILLGYTIYTIVRYASTAKQNITKKLKSYRFTASVLEDYGFRTAVFALLSFVATVAFATMNLVGAIKYRFVWYGAIAAYYFVLILFRGGVLIAGRKCARKYADDEGAYARRKWQIYLASGVFLVILEFAMAGTVTQMMLSERPAQGGEIMAISTAAYTFYKIIMATYNLIKARKLCDPVTQSLRNLNFADACMSVVSLTVLMITTFDGADTTSFMLYVKAMVGFVACALIVAMATVMILKGTKKLKGDFSDER